jgi:hypothetical protein
MEYINYLSTEYVEIVLQTGDFKGRQPDMSMVVTRSI